MVLNTMRMPLPTGESQHMESLSDRALGALGILAQQSNGLTIRGRFHLELHYNDVLLSTPIEGVPIEFDWISPSDEGIERMKLRLIRTLREGDPGGRRYHVLATHLNHPVIASAASSQDLIAGLEAWKQGSGADKILQHIDAHGQPNDGLVDYALRVIERRDHIRMLVLSRSTSLQDARLIEPLKAWSVDPANPHGNESALTLLSKQIDLASDRDALTSELGKTWLARSPFVRSGQWRADEAWRWTDEMHRLALTRDGRLMPILLPYLDRKEIVIDARQIAAANDGISMRACDVAFNTIMDVLGREGERFAIGMYKDLRMPGKMAQAKAHAQRDEIIARLKNEFIAE
jgi:hypothetical protein